MESSTKFTMTKEEAVVVIMKARGYEYKPYGKSGLRYGKYFWWKDNQTLNDEQALAECRDLNVLAEVWKMPAPGKYEFTFGHTINSPSWWFRVDDTEGHLNYLGYGFTLGESAMLATASAHA